MNEIEYIDKKFFNLVFRRMFCNYLIVKSTSKRTNMQPINKNRIFH